MLEYSFQNIGVRLYSIRKRLGMTQAEVAEIAGLSGRTYADIERGNVNMRLETILRICDALHITPNEVLICDDSELNHRQDELFERLSVCNEKDRNTALRLLEVYLQSIV